MFKELDLIYSDKPKIKALKVYNSMLTIHPKFCLLSKQSTLITHLSHSLRFDTKNNQVSTLINEIIDLLESWLTFPNGSMEVRGSGNSLNVNPSTRLGEVVGKLIPTFMEINANATAAAQSALVDFHYMPNTYNFARGTYDYPHDTYQLDSESSSVVHEPSGLDLNNRNNEVDQDEFEITQTQGTNEKS